MEERDQTGPTLDERIGADLGRLDTELDRVRTVFDHLFTGVEDDSFRRRSIAAAIATAGLFEPSELAGAAADLARADHEGFAYQYGRFSAGLDGLIAALDVLESRLPVGTEPDRNAALELLESRLTAVNLAAESLTKGAAQGTAIEDAKLLVAEFDQKLGDLEVQVAAAASEFGLDVQKLNWGAYADEEYAAANRWRWGAILGLVAAALVSILTILHITDAAGEWSEVGLRALASAALAALAGYAGAQSAEHRRAARHARQSALDFATISPYVARLEPEERRQVLVAFGLARFGAGDPMLDAHSSELSLGGELVDAAALFTLFKLVFADRGNTTA